MANFPVSALAAFLLLCAAVSAHAELTWTDKKLELSSDSTAATVEGHFHYVNAGAQAVDINRVVTTCGSTTAKLEKRHIEPGQSGEIVVTYTRGSRTGWQKSLVAVETGGQPATMLTLLVHIPEVVRLDPEFVTWTAQEPKTPKTIALKLVAPGKITKLEVQSPDPAVSAQVRGAVPGREFDLLVSPQDVRHFLRVVLSITCELDGKDKKTFTSYATVQPAGSL